MSLLTVLLTAISAGIALTSTTVQDRVASAAIASLTVASLLGVGLYACRRGNARFGPVLCLTGACWFLTTLSNSDVSLVYSVGRTAGWIFEAVLVYALLAYPTGRLETRASRLLAGGAAAVVVVLYLPTLPFAQQFPLPSPHTACVSGCPPNAFFAGTQPAALGEVIRPIRESLTFLIYVLAVGLLSARLWRAGPSLRRTLVPVLGAAVLRFVGASIYVAMRRADATDDVVEIAAVLALATIPATALGLLIGMLQWRVYSAGALAHLATGLGRTRTPAEVAELLADAIDTPDVELFYGIPAEPGSANQLEWFDDAGQPTGAPYAGDGRYLSCAEAESGLCVAIICDREFGDYTAFLQAVASSVVAAIDRQRLDAELAASLRDVEASRSRLASAADEARHQIERDLHDGAQQQLVALRMKLTFAREALDREPADATDLLAGLGLEIDEIIEEVRSLARGIYPPLLASSGLLEALRAAAMRSPLPVSVYGDGVGRLAPETETAVYFCCLEALQNAAKHATGATGVTITLSGDQPFGFEVSDDGCGFVPAAPAGGSGLTGMRDRIAAVGGELEIRSEPDRGTTIIGRLTPPPTVIPSR